MYPTGAMELMGLSSTTPFYTETMKEIGVKPEIIRHGKFKSAIEPFTLDKMSPENKEQMTALLNSFADNIMDSIACQRGLTLHKIQKHANNLSLENAKKCLELK